MTRRPSSQWTRRGYTAVELVMAVGLFAVGVSGVFAIQTVTAKTNHQAKALATATRIAESWQERLAIDGLRWTQTSPGMTQTTWLQAATTTPNTWLQPPASADFGPAFTAVGAFNDHTATPQNTVFCTNIRLTPLLTTPGSEMVRSEVRVFWPHSDRSGWGSANNPGDDYCDGATIAQITPQDFHFVYKTTVIRQTAGL